MIARKNFIRIDSVVVKTDEVFDDVEQAIFLKDTFKEGGKICKGTGFNIAVLGFPFHKAVFTAGDCTRLACKLVAQYANAVIDEHGRDFLNIVSDLRIGFACVGLFTAGRF